MARDDEDDAHWARQLVVALGVLAAVALVIGGVASVVALGAAKVTGLGGSSGPTTQARPSLYLPSGTPTTRIDPYPAPSGGSRPSSTPRSTPSATPSRRPKPALTLRATPLQVGANQRITLTGSYRGNGGSALQVQRFEGRWTDFPVTVTVTAGRFSTYITTGHTGVNRLRVLDPTTGRASDPVRVTVGG